MKLVKPTPLRHLFDTNQDDANQQVNALLKTFKAKVSNDTSWLPTPQEPGDETQDPPMQNVYFKN